MLCLYAVNIRSFHNYMVQCNYVKYTPCLWGYRNNTALYRMVAATKNKS